MKIQKVWAVYFSPTGGTKKIVEEMAKAAANALKVELGVIDFSLPAARKVYDTFSSEELVFFGTPVYAGRIPNKILPAVQECFSGKDTPTVLVAVYGNRNPESALAEQRQELRKNGFIPVAGAEITNRHAFSKTLGADRPDEKDIQEYHAFGAEMAEKVCKANSTEELRGMGSSIPEEVGPYYIPKQMDGTPAKFLKAKPLTHKELCTSCGKCAAVCPMASIDSTDYSSVTGICIKCCACIRICETGAKYFDDPAFLSHVKMVEANFGERKENKYYR